MPQTTLILLGAGNSTRFAFPVKKQWLYIGKIPLWLWVAEHFERTADFAKIIIVSSAREIAYMQHFASYTYVTGGSERQESLANALKEVETEFVLVSDIARCCVPSEMIGRLMDADQNAACVVPVLSPTDTLYLEHTPIPREKVTLIQTPQRSRTTLLQKALNTDKLFTDDSSAIASLGEEITFVEGSIKAHKLTTIEDLQKLSCLTPPSKRLLTGYGIDIHAFEADKTMRLGGVTLDVDYGLKAHSDGDVAIHALIDALLGAAGMGDIGELYPDTDEAYAGIDSQTLLNDTVTRLTSFGLVIQNIDMTILAEQPKITPYKARIRSTLAALLQIRPHLVNIKATRAEKMGFVGRKEGVTVHAVATLGYRDWTTL